MQLSNKFIKFFSLLCVGFSLCRVAYSESSISEKSELAIFGAATSKTLIVEVVSPYLVRSYQPAIEVRQNKDLSLAFNSPESAAITSISSVLNADFETNEKTWHEDALVELGKRDKQNKRGSNYWMDSWKKYAQSTATLTRRIDYGRYVLIEYQIKLSSPEVNNLIIDTVVLEKRFGVWKQTQSLANDPMLVHWDSLQRRIQIAPEAFYKK